MNKPQTDSKSANANNNHPLFSFSHEGVSESAKQNGEAVMRSLQMATTGANQICQAMAQYTQNLMQVSMAAFQALASARTLQDAAKIQNDYAKTSMDALVEHNTRISGMALKTANDTAQPLHQHANETMKKFNQRTAA